MDEIKKFRDKMMREGQKASDFFASIPADVWELQLYADGSKWSVHQVLAHVVETEGSLIRLFRHIVKGGSGVDENFDIDRYNASSLDDFMGLTPQDLVKTFMARRSVSVEFVNGLVDEDLERRGRHPFLGDASLNEMLRLFITHVNLHIRDIRKVI
jgi:uncharacterized damage-inducible protein DinB